MELGWWRYVLLSSLGVLQAAAYQVPVPSSGYATLTHYDLPVGYVASCGCVGRATRYPTAALNRLVYGSNTSFGPICGACYDLRLVSTPLAALNQPISFTPDQVDDAESPRIVVKIVDLCPGAGGPWCNATESQGNSLGSPIHFDLAWPSPAIPKSFFPGNHDYGVWNISYRAVSCDQWSGYDDRAALGSDWAQELSACCPNNPPPSGSDQACPPYWDTVGGANALSVPPNTSNPLSKGSSSNDAVSVPIIDTPSLGLALFASVLLVVTAGFTVL